MQARAAKQTDGQTDDVCQSVCVCACKCHTKKKREGKGRGLREVSQLQLLFCNNVLNLCQAAPKKKQATASETKGRREEGKGSNTHRDTVTNIDTHTQTDTIEAQSRHSNRTMQLGRLLRLPLCVCECVCVRTCD